MHVLYQYYNAEGNYARACVLYKEGRKYKQLVVVNKNGGLDLVNVPLDTKLTPFTGGNIEAHKITLGRLAEHKATQVKARRAVKEILNGVSR